VIPMPADDVTDKDTPLRGGRQRANHIQVHRIEAGLWERQNLLQPVAKIADTASEFAETARIVKTAAIGAVGVASVGAVWVAYKIGKSLYEWVDEVGDALDTAGNVFATGAKAGIKSSVWGPVLGVLGLD